ncbi:MAG: hypothetical protein AAGF47_01030, partial [Planctomycetota bacterium]
IGFGRLGDEVVFRPTSSPDLSIPGVVVRVTPSGSKTIQQAALTGEGGGDIAISPITGEANEPYFQVEVLLEPGPHSEALTYGMTGRVLIGSRVEPVGRWLWRAGLRLMQKLERG